MGRIVIVGYKPKAGQSRQLAELMKTHVNILRDEGLVTLRESIIMQSKDGTVIEIFEWMSKQAIDDAHNNPIVQKMWQDFSEVCDYIPVSGVSELSTLFSEFTPLN